MTKDLGTYHVRIELIDGRGWIETWFTGKRYTYGSGDVTKLDADLILPTWESEEELIETIEYMYTFGNYACDCNKLLNLARAHQQEEPAEDVCGHTLEIKRLTLIRPDISELVIFPEGAYSNEP